MLATSMLTSTEITRAWAAATARHRALSRTVPTALLTLPPLDLDDRGPGLVAQHTLVRGKDRRIR
jgi:hypothetical protein